MLEAIVAAMLALAPREPIERIRNVATAIDQASRSVEDAAVLVTISYYETYFERRGIPFGMVSWRRRLDGQPLVAWARASLEMLRRARRCGEQVEVFLGWYHTGRCEPDAFSRRQAETCRQVHERLIAATRDTSRGRDARRAGGSASPRI